MNIFYNYDENRLRAGWRILLQFVLFVLFGLGLLYLLNQAAGASLEIYTSLSLFLGSIGSIWIAARYLDHYALDMYGLAPDSRWFKELGLGIAFGAAAMGFIFAVEWAAGWVTLTGFGWERVHELPYAAWFANYLAAMALVGFYEELIFRGYQVRNLTDGFRTAGQPPARPVLLAVGASSLVFGLLHAGNPNAGVLSTLNIVLAGVVIASPFIITGRLGLSVGLHFAWNFFQGGIFGFPVSGMPFRGSLLQVQQSGPQLVTGGSFGPEAGLLGIAGLALALALILLYLKQSHRKIEIHSSFTTPAGSRAVSNNSPEQAK